MTEFIPPKRPVDVVFPGRQEAILTGKCLPPPAGCGGEATEFRDPVSTREYQISGLCQKCQDEVFGGQ